MTNWQPMDTAPKDGTWVLVYDDGVQVVAKYMWQNNWLWATHLDVSDWHWATHLDASEGHKVYQTCVPSRWMPLPNPPELGND